MASVEISDECYKVLERIVRQSVQFENVDALVNYILNATAETVQQKREVPQALEERLRDLGYL
jgi:hypothetical protein